MAKRPYEIALAMLKAEDFVTPAQINAAIGDGFATRYVWQLRKLGYDISVEKDGRTITSYTYNGVGYAQEYEDKMAARAQKEIDKNMKLVEREVAKEAKAKARAEAKAAKEAEEVELDEEVESATTGEYAIDETFDEYDQPLEKLVA